MGFKSGARLQCGCATPATGWLAGTQSRQRSGSGAGRRRAGPGRARQGKAGQQTGNWLIRHRGVQAAVQAAVHDVSCLGDVFWMGRGVAPPPHAKSLLRA